MSVKYYHENHKRTNVRISKISGHFLFLVSSILWFILPGLVHRFIIKHFFAPRRTPLSKSDSQILDQGEKFELPVNNQKLVCWKYGQGPAIIFVHGWNGRGAQFQRFINKVTKMEHSVIIFDGPGHGYSEGESSSYFEMTDATRAVIKYCFESEIGIKGFIGHSFGAAAIINALQKERLQIPATLIAPALSIRGMLEEAFHRYGVPMHIFHSIIDEYSEKFGYSLHKDDPLLLIKQLDSRILIIHDKTDKVTTFETSETVAGEYDFIDLIATDGLGHSRILKNKMVIENSLDFINKHMIKMNTELQYV